MNIFDSLDYRAVIRDLIKASPRGGHGQLSKLAQHLGVNATLVSQVLSGLKDFSSEQACGTCEFFHLSGLELEYFLLLVQRSRAGTRSLQKFYDQKILDIRNSSLDLSKRLKKDREFLDSEKAVFYSSWLYSAVRMLASIGTGLTVEAAAARFQIPYGKAKEILEFLTQTGLCVYENENYRMGPQQTHLEFGSPFRVQHLSNWHNKAVQALDRVTEKELLFSACVSVSRKDFAKIRELLTQAIANTAETVKASEAEDVACFNLGWFWVRS